MQRAPRYATLTDYLRVIREQRVLIVVITFLFAGAAVLLASQEEPVYVASSSAEFSDEADDSQLLGTPLAPQELPGVRAAVNAQRMSQADVLSDARLLLGAQPPTTKELSSAVVGSVDSLTNLVIITVRWDDATMAARIADAVATAAVRQTVDRARSRYRGAAREIRGQLRAIGRRPEQALNRQSALERLNRLNSLAEIARPARLATRATVPDGPVSPKPVRNGVLGGLLGLTLGLLIAFMRDSLDRRLRSIEEIRNEMEMPLLGHVRKDMLGRTVISNGRSGLTDADFEAFRILRTNLEFLDVDANVRRVVVTSALPEEGKSTVSASLACAFAVAGKRTLLVECDLRRPTVAKRFGLGDGPGLADYLSGNAEPASVVQTVVLKQGGRAYRDAADASVDGDVVLACITAGSPTSRPAELLGSKRFAEFLDQVSEVYDAVVIDTSPLLSVVDTLELVPLVDALVLCVRAQQTTRDQARAARAAIAHLPDRPVGVVVTGVNPRDAVDYGYYSYSYAAGRRGD